MNDHIDIGLARYSDWAFTSSVVVLVGALLLLAVELAYSRSRKVIEREVVGAGVRPGAGPGIVAEAPRRVIVVGHEPGHEGLDVGHRVERRARALGVALVDVGDVTLHEERAVGQHDRAQIDRGRRRVDRGTAALGDERRQVPGMVEMRVRDDQEIDRPDTSSSQKRQDDALASVERLPRRTTVDENPAVPRSSNQRGVTLTNAQKM